MWYKNISFQLSSGSNFDSGIVLSYDGVVVSLVQFFGSNVTAIPKWSDKGILCPFTSMNLSNTLWKDQKHINDKTWPSICLLCSILFSSLIGLVWFDIFFSVRILLLLWLHDLNFRNISIFINIFKSVHDCAFNINYILKTANLEWPFLCFSFARSTTTTSCIYLFCFLWKTHVKYFFFS